MLCVVSSSLFSPFFCLWFLTWYPLPGSSLRFLFFVSFFFPRVLIGEYSGIYYPRLLSLSPNFAFEFFFFSNPYLDPASSTLLASLVYALFLLRLRSWSCYPRSFASFEPREVPHSHVFFCVSRYLLSRYIVLALFTVVLFCTILAPFTFPIFLDIYYLITSLLLCYFLIYTHTHTHKMYTLPLSSFFIRSLS